MGWGIGKKATASTPPPLTRRPSPSLFVHDIDVLDAWKECYSSIGSVQGGSLGSGTGRHSPAVGGGIAAYCPLCLQRLFGGDAANVPAFASCGHQQGFVHAACYEKMPNRVCIYCREDIKALPTTSSAMIKLMMETMGRSSSEEAVAVRGAQAMVVLAFGDRDNVEAFEKFHGCRLLCEVLIMHSDSVGVVSAVLEAIIALCSVENTAGKKLLGQFDAPSLAVSALRTHSDRADLQAKALTAISKLCVADPANILVIEWSDGCMAVVNTIKQRALTKDLIMRGLVTLKALGLYDLQSDSPLVEAGGHKLMNRLLQIHEQDRDIVWMCMHVLASMATTPISCDLLEAVGASKDISRLMNTHATDGDIQLECCCAIASMASWSDELRERFGENCCRMLIKALKNWATSPIFLIPAFRAVEVLTAPSPSGELNAAFFSEKGVGVLVIATLQSYAGSRMKAEYRDLVFQALKVLTGLMLYPRTPQQLMDAGLEGAMNLVTKGFRTDKEIMELLARLKEYVGSGKGSEHKMQWDNVADIFYKMTFGIRRGGESRAAAQREGREPSASINISTFMGFLNRAPSTRYQSRRGSASQSRRSVTEGGGGGPALILGMDQTATRLSAPGDGGGLSSFGGFAAYRGPAVVTPAAEGEGGGGGVVGGSGGQQQQQSSSQPPPPPVSSGEEKDDGSSSPQQQGGGSSSLMQGFGTLLSRMVGGDVGPSPQAVQRVPTKKRLVLMSTVKEMTEGTEAGPGAFAGGVSSEGPPSSSPPQSPSMSGGDRGGGGGGGGGLPLQAQHRSSVIGTTNGGQAVVDPALEALGLGEWESYDRLKGGEGHQQPPTIKQGSGSGSKSPPHNTGKPGINGSSPKSQGKGGGRGGGGGFALRLKAMVGGGAGPSPSSPSSQSPTISTARGAASSSPKRGVGGGGGLPSPRTQQGGGGGGGGGLSLPRTQQDGGSSAGGGGFRGHRMSRVAAMEGRQQQSLQGGGGGGGGGDNNTRRISIAPSAPPTVGIPIGNRVLDDDDAGGGGRFSLAVNLFGGRGSGAGPSKGGGSGGGSEGRPMMNAVEAAPSSPKPQRPGNNNNNSSSSSNSRAALTTNDNRAPPTPQLGRAGSDDGKYRAAMSNNNSSNNGVTRVRGA